MTPELKRRIAYYAGMGSLAALAVLLSVWAFSRPHSPLEYMVGGTLGTSVFLAGAFVRIVRKGYLGRSRRTEMNSGRSPADPLAGS